MNRLLRISEALLPILLAYILLIFSNEVQRYRLGSEGKFRIHAVKHTPQCGWECYQKTSAVCLQEHAGLPASFRESIRLPYFGMIALLAGTGDYFGANLLFLALLWPLLMSVGTMRCMRLLRGGRSVPRGLTIGALLTATALGIYTLVFSFPEGHSLKSFVFNYLTDFILTLSHWTGLSYYDINALVFVVAWPLLTLALLIFWPLLEKRASA